MSRVDIIDQDIEIAEKKILNNSNFDAERRNILRNLESVDIVACAGSGKTTLMCAKVEILCRKQSLKDKGICILSHTNVAINEIRKKLGEKHGIFKYPNYCETIQKFVGEFVFKKWYYGTYRRKLSYIDDIICLNSLKREIKKIDRNVLIVLEKNRFYFENLTTDGKNIYYKDVLLDDVAPCGNLKIETWNKYKATLKAAKIELVKKGIFNFDDIFYISNRYLELNVEISKVIKSRFEYIMIDEVQDVKEIQLKVLKNIFEGSIVQNIGDPNQQIYEKECWKLDKVMTIKDSMRCSCNIAKFASKFEVSSTNMSGRKNNNIKVKFIVYNDENINKVKEVFAKQIIGNG